MKVFRITNSLDYGGIERVFELHAKYHRSDYELVLIALASGGKAEKAIAKRGLRVIILQVNSAIPSWQGFRTLFTLFRKEKPDIVHTCGAEANFHGLIAAFLAGVPRRVGEEIGIPAHSFRAKLVFRIIFMLAGRVIAISHAVKNYLSAFEVPSRKLKVIYNPIDKVKQHIHSRGSDSFRISFAGRLEPIKNISMLIDLLKILMDRYPARKFELWIVGTGTQQEFLMNHAHKSGVASQVKFLGYVEEPGQLLVQTDAFVLPSLFEGFGLACIEAIQSGLPVIVSNSGGMTEYIKDGFNGFLFDPNSLSALVEKTELLLTMEQDKRKAMICNAASTIDEMFSPDKYLNELKEVYF